MVVEPRLWDKLSRAALICCGGKNHVLGETLFQACAEHVRGMILKNEEILSSVALDQIKRQNENREHKLAQSASSVAGIAERYAGALFELALGEKKLAPVEKDLARFDALIKGSDDLSRLVVSPIFAAEDQEKAIAAVLAKAKIGGLAGNFIRVIAKNRRLFIMPQMLSVFRRLIAEHKGEASADVTVAAKLAPAMKKELAAALKSSIGKSIAINEIIDPSILGGMIVKIGSRQVDSSLKTKLSSLKLALKEVQ